MLIRNITKITNDSFKKLNEDVNKILLEDIDAVKKVFMNRFPEMSDEEFDEIIKLDPTYKEGSNSVGKYGKWLLGLYKKDNPLEYDIEEIYGLLSSYDNYKNDRKKEIEKDINKFKSIEDLNDAVNNAGEAELSDRQKEREIRNSKNIEKVFEDNKWEVWTPLSYDGSCTLGKGTKWCTADSRTREHYDSYTREGPLYIFINKQDHKEKYQLHVETKSFRDKNDYKAHLGDILSTDDKLKEFVEEKIYGGFIKDKSGAYIYTSKNGVPKYATSVIVEQGVTAIGEYAFDDCKSLQSVVIPNSVTSIGRYAFSNCIALQSVVIPNSVTSIDECAFLGCTSLQSINIPNSVTEIGDNAFAYCKSLQSVTIPDSVIRINSNVFYNCKSLQSITIPDSVTSIDVHAFYDCESLQSITIPDSVTSIGDRSFYNCKSLQSITIPNSVTSIGWCAFQDCESLQSITIPDSVTNIGDGAFWGCKSFKSITIPNSVTSLGGSAFIFCTSLKSINIPDSVASIDRDTFAYCTSLQSINIPNSVTKIGKGAFGHCDSLQSITIPNSVTSIGPYAFEDCISLESITIPNSVTSIGDFAFNGCKSFKSITIPDSVTSIGSRAFYRCDKLKEVTLKNPNTEYENAFLKRTKIIKKGANESMKIRKNKHNKVHHNHNGFIEAKGIKESKNPVVIDAHKFSNMRKEDILNVLDDMPVGTKLSGIVDAPGTYGAEHFGHLGDVVVEKRSAYVANIYNPISSPNDWKYKDIYWTISGDKKYNWDIANIILGKDKYYCLSDMATNESINIRKAKRLMEKNGYKVVQKDTIHESLPEDDYDDFLHKIYNDLVKVMYKYRYKYKGISQDDFEMAIEFFINHFFESDDYWVN